MIFWCLVSAGIGLIVGAFIGMITAVVIERRDLEYDELEGEEWS